MLRDHRFLARLIRGCLCVAICFLFPALSAADCTTCNPATDPTCNPECGRIQGPTSSVTVPPIGSGSDLRLTVDCAAPPGVPEGRITVSNLSSTLEYQVRVRGQVVCPPDPGEPDVCMCPQGYADWFEPGVHLCNEWSCNDDCAPSMPDFQAYPKQLNPMPTECSQEGDWIWCDLVIQPGQSAPTYDLAPLNTCCDCDFVRKSIVCGEVKVQAYRIAGSGASWTPAPAGSDLLAQCRDDAQVATEGGFLLTPHPVANVSFTCFQPLSTFCPAPSAIIVDKPANPSCATYATFTFSSSSTTPDFECELDNTGFIACSSPFQIPSLDVGQHRFEVRDRSAANPTHDIYLWTVNPSAPACSGGGGGRDPLPDKDLP